MTNISLEHLAEPTLQFGHYFEHQDTKTGLAEYGPFGLNIEGLHPSEMKLGFVGTRETIAGAKEWIELCSHPIESENIQVVGSATQASPGGLFEVEVQQPDPRMKRVNKILNRDFVGLSMDSPFRCRFLTNERWDRTLTSREIEHVLQIPNKEQRIWALVELFSQQIESLATMGPVPTIIVLALTPEIIEQADSVQLSGNFYLNFRRAIKAKAMRWGIPLQILQRRTVLGKDPLLQEKTLRAWNFCTAQYYKAQGIPWRPTNLAQDTCYIGISFYVARDLNDQLTVRASVAQAFDYLGQGLVLRGEPFQWSAQQGTSPHMTRGTAANLLRDTLNAYIRLRRVPPQRVVIHKTSEFWGKEHGEYDERSGIEEGIDAVFSHCEIDLVTLRPAGLRLFREGAYPPLRGTYVILEDQHFLYTTGFIPYLDTYPGSSVPIPWHLAQHYGSTSPKELLQEILILTKMNVNNCAFADGTPITLSFAQMIGEIMKHVPDGDRIQPTYQFYM